MSSQSPSKWLPSPKTPPLCCIAEHDVRWCGISLWSIWVRCPACVPSRLMCTPPNSWCGVGSEQSGEKEKTLTLCKYCWTATRILVCPFSVTQNAASYELLWRKLVTVGNLSLGFKSTIKKIKNKNQSDPNPVSLWYRASLYMSRFSAAPNWT